MRERERAGDFTTTSRTMKSKGTTTRKAPTKRSAPASGKKTAAAGTSTKKKGQTDEPFDDRTNEDIDESPEDAPSDAKQSKKGRTADKAKPTTARGGKKGKAT